MSVCSIHVAVADTLSVVEDLRSQLAEREREKGEAAEVCQGQLEESERGRREAEERLRQKSARLEEVQALLAGLEEAAREVCGVEKDVWGGGRCVGWRKMCGVQGSVWGGSVGGGERCMGWKEVCGVVVCGVEEGVCGVEERGRREVRRVEKGEGGCRCTGWREEGEVCMYSDLSQLNPVRLGIQCCACGMD